MSKKCTTDYCNKDNPDEARYCMYCGSPFTDGKSISYHSLQRDFEEAKENYNSAFFAVYAASFSIGMLFSDPNQSIWWAILEAALLSIPIFLLFAFIHELAKLIFERVKKVYFQYILFGLILFVCALLFYL